MAATMKSARFHAKEDIRIDEIPLPPPPGAGELTIDVLWGGICGTDLAEFTAGPLTINTKERPHGITGDYLPVAFGHEFCGRVTVLPDGYSDTKFTIGTPVMVDPRIVCRSCTSCTSGRDNICENWGYIGLNGGGGGGAGFSEKVNVAMHMCHPLPNDGTVDLDSVVLCQPLTVGRHALASGGVPNNDYTGMDILVLGGGPVGLAVLLNLRAKGVGVGLSGRVFVSEPTAKRSSMITNLNLSNDLLDPTKVDVAAECRARTNGKGVDIVFDSAGAASAMLAGMAALKIRGTYVNIAGWKTPFQIPMQFAMFREITIKFSLGNDDNDYREVVEDFVAGKFGDAPRELITRRLPVEELAEKGLRELVRNKDAHVKIVATWRRELLEKYEHGESSAV